MEDQKSPERTACVRCGTCCKNGGPALHKSDLASVRTGKIPPEVLYTIRAGEIIRDNINGGLIRISEEMIKIKSDGDSTRCFFFRPNTSGCTIYENRPVECRVMKCWDTSEIVRIHDRDRLNRMDLFGEIPWLKDIITINETHCSYSKISELAARRESGDQSAGAALSETVSNDNSLREFVIEKEPRTRHILDLLFGRALKITLPGHFGIRCDFRQ